MAPPVRQPAEWEPHEALWTAWPSHRDYWGNAFVGAQAEVAAFLRALTGAARGNSAVPERVEVWVDGPATAEAARRKCGELPVAWVEAAFGDIWFRDVAPILLKRSDGRRVARCLRHNGWGEKYRMEGDDSVAARMVARHRIPARFLPLTGEGGGLESNGKGLFLSTRSCFLNTNRNPRWEEADVERVLREELGAETVLWLDEGLANDHTDGHIDNLVRFVDARTVVCQHPSGRDDPNRDCLRAIIEMLAKFRLPSGDRLDVVEIPSPGRVLYDDGSLAPASHVNFYIANHRVLVPCYGGKEEAEALALIGGCFSDREVIGLPARHLLAGGGAFHCITQQVPAVGQ